MWLQFYLENIHFAIGLFAGLIFLAASWLYFDAWLGLGYKPSFSTWLSKRPKEGLKAFGFLFLGISFIIFASTIETNLLPQQALSQSLLFQLFLISKILGFGLIIVSLLKEPLQPRPKTQGITRENLVSMPVLMGSVVDKLTFLNPVLSLVVAGLYFRKSYFGLENHLKGIARSFAVLTVFEILNLLIQIFKDSQNSGLYNLFSPFGGVWVLEHLILLLSSVILARWVFGYLLKQLQTQLMIILTGLILVVFLMTTVVFTSILIQNLQAQSLDQLNKNAKVLNLALETKQNQLLSDSQSISLDPDLKTAILAKDYATTFQISQKNLIAKKLASLIITDPNGQIIARGEDSSRVGNSISSDPLIQNAIALQPASSIASKNGVLSPIVTLEAETPIVQDGKLVGVVLVSSNLDNTFVDNVKKETGLEASIYGKNTLSATTLLMPDNKSAAVGIETKDSNITQAVLTKGQDYQGAVEVLNKDYYGSFLPLKDASSQSIGMLFVGELQTEVLTAAGAALEITFILAALVIVIALLPITLVSRYITYQLK